MMNDRRGWLIAGICAWELGGLADMWPTITAVVHHNRHRAVTVGAVYLAVGAVLWHLLVEEPRPTLRRSP